jgi:hypothetical protein
LIHSDPTYPTMKIKASSSRAALPVTVPPPR